MRNTIIVNAHDVIEATTDARETCNPPIDFEKLQPLFGWMPLDTIEKTFQKTTQFCCCPVSTLLRKTFKSPYPACNVHWRQEPIATDTVFSDTPAIDCGHKVAQIFVGTESMVTDVFGMHTSKQFINTFQEIIRIRGAQTKLISDCAKVKISEKVQDVL